MAFAGGIVPCNIDLNDYNDFKSLGVVQKVGCSYSFFGCKNFAG